MKRWLAQNKIILMLFLGLSLLCFILYAKFYQLLSQQLVKVVYEGGANPILEIFSNIIFRTFVDINTCIHPDLHPLEFYLQKASELFLPILMVLSVIWLAILVYFMSPKLDRPLGKIYEFIIVKADSLNVTNPLFIAGASLIGLVILAYFAIVILQGFPNSGDEYCYLFQAKCLLKGKLWVDQHPLQEFFSFWHICEHEGRLFSKYPPGWPILLALGQGIKLSWLVNPLISLITLFVIYLVGKDLFNKKIGLITVATIIPTPFFLFNSASYFTHPSCLLFLLCFLLFLQLSLKQARGGLIFDLLAGVSLGMAFLIRQYTAILWVMPFCLFWLVNMINQKGIKKLFVFGLGSGLLFLFYLWYNLKLTGNPCLTPAQLYAPENIPQFQNLGLSIELSGTYLCLLSPWTLIYLPIIFVWVASCFVQDKNKIKIGLLLSPIFLVIAGHLIFPFSAGNQYGPRYYYEVFPLIILSITACLFKEPCFVKKSKISKYIFGLWLLSMLLNIPILWHRMGIERQVVRERTDVYQQIAHHKIKNAIIFLETGTGSLREMPVRDLTRNALDFSNDVLYAADLGEKNSLLMRYYPHKEYYLYSYKRSVDKRLKKISGYDLRKD